MTTLNKKSFKKAWIIFLSFTMFISVNACSSKTDPQDNDDINDEIIVNDDSEKNDTDNNNFNRYNKTKDALITRTKFGVPPNSTQVMKVNDGYLFSSTDDVSVIVDYYADYKQLNLLFSSDELQYYTYQSRLVEYLKTSASDISASDFNEQMNKWVDGLAIILNEDGYLAAVLIYGIGENPDNVVAVEIRDNLDKLPSDAKTAIYVPLTKVEY